LLGIGFNCNKSCDHQNYFSHNLHIIGCIKVNRFLFYSIPFSSDIVLFLINKIIAVQAFVSAFKSNHKT